MNVDFSALVPVIVGYGCFLLALLFWFVWPKAKARPYSKKISWPGYILHYFHPLAWVFFGLAAFFLGSQPIIGIIMGVLGIITIFIFITIFLKV